MRRWAVAVGVLVALAVTLGAALAGNSYLATKQLKWREVGSILAADTTNLIGHTGSTGAYDTTRTEWFDTSDWDWDAIRYGIAPRTAGVAMLTQVDSVQLGPRLTFVCSGQTGTSAVGPFSKGATNDSLYWTVEVKTPSSNPADTAWAYNGLVVGARGTCAVLQGTGIGNTQAGGNIFTGYLICDPSSYNINNVWMVKKFRLRVVGDGNAATNINFAFKCFITYPKLK